MNQVTKFNYDVKMLDPLTFKPLPKLFKYLYIISIILLINSLIYGGFKVFYTMSNLSSYKTAINNINIYKQEIDEIDNKISATGKLYTFFEKQQQWLTTNYSISKVWSDIFQSTPNFINLDTVKLNFVDDSFLISMTYVKHRRSSPNPLTEFSKKIESLGYEFILKKEGSIKKGEYFVEGQLLNNSKKKESLNEKI